MAAKPKQPPSHVVELVDPRCQATKGDMEEEWTVSDMSLDEAARRVLEPVEVRTIPRPRRTG